MSIEEKAQKGVLSDPSPHVEYLTFVLREDFSPETQALALSYFGNVEKSISQKDTTANLSLTIGFGLSAWQRLFPQHPIPQDLSIFEDLREADRHFPSTSGDIFIMVKSNRLDLNYQASKYLYQYLSPIAELVEDIQGYKYLDDRDLIDFVDGTENPHGQERIQAILSTSKPYEGGSYLTVQRYTDRQKDWDALTTEEQEGVIGRTKLDDIEIAEEEKKPYAHNVKSKLSIDDIEIKMLRQNRAWGGALEHGTMFIGFAAEPSVIEKSLKQMIYADKQGYYDKLLDFVEAKTGTNYFVPPASFIDSLES